MSLQFQADAFNAFNRANWNNPNVGNAGSASFGQITVLCRVASCSSAASLTSNLRVYPATPARVPNSFRHSRTPKTSKEIQGARCPIQFIV